MAGVTYDKATRIYPGTEKPAVDALDLEIGDGEFLVVVGPSGCGKSTALRMLAGLEDIDAGAIRIGGRDVTHLPPKERDIAMVFQNYALYPHMTVADNMGFALKIAGMSKDDIKARVAEAAKLLDLEPYLERKPKALSGGQRQRVAMGRAIVRKPQVFLMDEPLSNLDAKLRVQTRTQIASLQTRLGITTVYVTHDQIEAMTMGDRVAVLKDGLLHAGGHPAAALRPPGERLRGGLHRLAGDEPGRGQAQRAGRRPRQRRHADRARDPRCGRVQGRQDRHPRVPARGPADRGGGRPRRGRPGRGARRRRLRLRTGGPGRRVEEGRGRPHRRPPPADPRGDHQGHHRARPQPRLLDLHRSSGSGRSRPPTERTEPSGAAMPLQATAAPDDPDLLFLPWSVPLGGVAGTTSWCRCRAASPVTSCVSCGWAGPSTRSRRSASTSPATSTSCCATSPGCASPASRRWASSPAGRRRRASRSTRRWSPGTWSSRCPTARCSPPRCGRTPRCACSTP